MSDVILKVENVSKIYRLGTVGTGTFGGDVQRFWKTKILGQEDPFLKIGQTNDRTSKEKADFVWALRDINFEVKRGEVLGVIGKNGAGKSTLLKLLSRITSPTTGSIRSAGRMASLLEVGTGFHPELTGRENIFLNGAILGMTKKEIQSKFDEIVDFSGCDLYIDTPTKRYSSGMTVRLGFAVAAFLDPEILVVDEVLAVGDAEFQKKAIGKMKEVSSSGGRTVLFVSHNMNSIRQLCSKGLLLQNGSIKMFGSIGSVLDEYFTNGNELPTIIHHQKYKYQGLDDVILKEVSILNVGPKAQIPFDQDIEILFNIQSKIKRLQLSFAISCVNTDGITIFTLRSNLDTVDSIGLKHGYNSFKCNVPAILREGRYRFDFGISIGERTALYYIENCFELEIISIGKEREYKINNMGMIDVHSTWKSLN